MEGIRESSSPASGSAGVTLRILGDDAVAYGATCDVARTVTTHLFGISPNNSGSTFLQRALATCRATWNLPMEGQRMPGFAGPASFCPLVPGEPRLDLLWAADRRWREHFADPGAYDWPRTRRAWYFQAYARDPEASVFYTKSPPHLVIVDELARHFRNAKFLFMVRDPYAVCEGIIRAYRDHLPHRYEALRLLSPNRTLPELAAAHVVACLAWQRRNVEAHGDRGAFFTYEAMCAEPERVEHEIRALVPALDDLRLCQRLPVKGQYHELLTDMNARQIACLDAADRAECTRVFREHRDVIDWFGYELMNAALFAPLMTRGPDRASHGVHEAAPGRDLPPLRDYTAYGLHVRSAVALPFASAAAGPAGRPDVAVRFGETPPRLPRAVRRTPPVWEAAPGVALLHVEDVARYLVTDGREIAIETCGGRDEDVVTFLVGPVFAALLQQRGIVTLHAAAVETDAGAALLLGASGSGKSSLAAALVERGHALLADHVTGVVLDAGGRPTALPAFPYLRLWADSLDRLRLRARARVRPELEKYWVPAERFGAAPLPVCAAFVLEPHNRPDLAFEPVPPGTAFRELWDNTYRDWMQSALGRGPDHFRAGTEMARRVPVVRVKRPECGHPFRWAALADRVEAYLHGAGTEAGSLRSPETAHPAPRPAAHEQRRPTGGRRPLPPAASDAGGASVPAAVWLASYPKCSSTWLRAVLTAYLQDELPSINALEGPWLSNSRREFDELIGLDSSDLTPDETARYLSRFRERLVEEMSASRAGNGLEGPGRNGPVFIKTHEAYRIADGVARFPRAGTAGAVYLVRNPLDVAVSYAYHLQWPIDAVIRLMNNPAAVETWSVSRIHPAFPSPLATWSGHVSSWMDQTALRIHAARYEDLLKDPWAGFGAIIRFAGLAWDGLRLDRAVEHAAFPRLQAQEKESGYSGKQPTAPSFFRAGVAGSWRTALRRAHIGRIV